MTVTMQNRLMSIVLPIYNQADHVTPLVDGYVRATADLPFRREFLLVVNGCRDHSLELCRGLATRHTCVRVLCTERAGWGAAVKYGLREAQGEILCYTNSARTTSDDLTLLLLYGSIHPNTVVKANRRLRENWQRRLGSLLFNLECRTLFDLAHWDVNGTPKVFPRSFERLLALSRDDDLIDAEFSLVCRRENYRMIEIPIFSERRRGGRSTTTLRSAVRLYQGAYELWRNVPEAA
jgi:glycosyltransferase involved in cell wall biosynthesis